MDMLHEVLREVIGIVLVGIGSLVAVLVNIIVSKIKEEYGVEDIVDKHVRIAEQEIEFPKAGKIKKERVKDAVKEELKKAGIGIGKRILITVFGRISRSIDKSVKRNINGQVEIGRNPRK